MEINSFEDYLADLKHRNTIEFDKLKDKANLDFFQELSPIEGAIFLAPILSVVSYFPSADLTFLLSTYGIESKSIIKSFKETSEIEEQIKTIENPKKFKLNLVHIFSMFEAYKQAYYANPICMEIGGNNFDSFFDELNRHKEEVTLIVNESKFDENYTVGELMKEIREDVPAVLLDKGNIPNIRRFLKYPEKLSLHLLYLILLDDNKDQINSNTDGLDLKVVMFHLLDILILDENLINVNGYHDNDGIGYETERRYMTKKVDKLLNL